MSDTYHHGNLKEALIEDIKKSVTEQLMGELEEAVRSAANAENAIVGMGKRYVSFFRSKPDYYKFLFGRRSPEIKQVITG